MIRFIFPLLFAFVFVPITLNAQVQPDSTTKGRLGTQPDSSSTEQKTKRLTKTEILNTKVQPGKTRPDSNATARSGEKNTGKKDRKSRKAARANEPHDPKKAVRRSILVPGWGQIYNRSWWKTPVIYVGFASFGTLIWFYNREYQLYRNALICKLDSCGASYQGLDTYGTPTETFIDVRDFNRRWRDLNIIFCGLWYALNVVDAFVEGHLKEFNVSDDLSLRVSPGFQFNPISQRPFLGASFTLRLRK